AGAVHNNGARHQDGAGGDMSKQPDIRPSEITPEHVFMNRRSLLQAAVAAGLVPAAFKTTHAAVMPPNGEFSDVRPWPGSVKDKPNTFEEITTYNNYYE